MIQAQLGLKLQYTVVRVETGIKAEVKAEPVHTQALEKQKQAGLVGREGGLMEGGGGDTAVASASNICPNDKEVFLVSTQSQLFEKRSSEGVQRGRLLVSL